MALGLAYSAVGSPLDNDECGVLISCLEGDKPAYLRETFTWLAYAVTQTLGLTSVPALQAGLVVVSLGFSVFTLVAIGELTTRLASERAAYAAILLSTTLQAVGHQFAGARLLYATSLAFSSWALVEFVKWVDADDAQDSGGAGTRALTRFAVLSALAFAAHRVTGPLFPIGVLAGLLCGRTLRGLLRPRPLVGAAVWLVAVAWFLVLWPHAHASGHTSLSSSLADAWFVARVLGEAFPLLAAAAVVGVIAGWRSSRGVRALSVWTCLYALVVGALLDRVTGRYFLHLVPAIVALAAVAVSHLLRALRERNRRRVGLLLAALVVAAAAEALIREGLDAWRRGGDPLAAWTSRVVAGYGPRRPAALAGLRARCAAESIQFAAWGSDQSSTAWHYLGASGGGASGVRLHPHEGWTRADLDAARARMRAVAPGDASPTHVLLVLTRFGRGPIVERIDQLLADDPAVRWRATAEGYDAWQLALDPQQPGREQPDRSER